MHFTPQARYNSGMFVPIIENWSEILGDIKGVSVSHDIGGFNEVDVLVREVHPVEDFPNLLEDAAGSTLKVFFPQELASELDLCPGCGVRCWVRKAPLSRHFVHREHASRME